MNRLTFSVILLAASSPTMLSTLAVAQDFDPDGATAPSHFADVHELVRDLKSAESSRYLPAWTAGGIVVCRNAAMQPGLNTMTIAEWDRTNLAGAIYSDATVFPKNLPGYPTYGTPIGRDQMVKK